MKLFSWLITLPFLALCVLFAVSNRQLVTVDLWPLDYVISAPLYILTLGAYFCGLIMGATWLWLSGLRTRWDKRKLTKQVDKLKTKLTAEQNKPLSL